MKRSLPVSQVLSSLSQLSFFFDMDQDDTDMAEPQSNMAQPPTEMVQPQTEMLQPQMEMLQPQTEMLHTPEMLQPPEMVYPQSEMVYTQTAMVLPQTETPHPQENNAQSQTETVGPPTNLGQSQISQLSEKQKALIFTWYSNFDITYADVADAFTQHTGRPINRFQVESVHRELCKIFNKRRNAPAYAMYYRHRRVISLDKLADLEASLEGAKSLLINATRTIYEQHLKRMEDELRSAEDENNDIMVQGSHRSQQFAEQLGKLDEKIQKRRFSIMQSIVKLDMIKVGWPQQRHWIKRG
ncbi:MAG: hypothetical protein Q9174_001252 [Haloplaca sp. 1 TL-2023]